MRITCPSCGAEYDVAEAAVPPGRAVRCTRCAEEWTPVPLPPAATTEIAIPQAPAPMPAPTSAPVPSPIPPTVRPAPTVVRPIRAGQVADQLATPISAPTAPATKKERSFAPATPSAAPLPRFIEPEAEPPARRGGAAIGWVLTLLILCGAAFAAYQWRADVIRTWPPSERAYRALGLTAN